ncbi:MAG: hypothetical protein QOH10_719 [Actinomycetota bacterium]|jgi:hypothetical protein|nr:hypothetical protein [Actinomycetota bacterium]
MRLLGSRRQLTAQGRISGTLPTEMVPPMWGRGEFVVSPRTIEFRTRAGALHVLGRWAAISTYQVTPNALTLCVPRGPYFVTVELPRSDDDSYSQILQLLIERGVREAQPDY